MSYNIFGIQFVFMLFVGKYFITRNMILKIIAIFSPVMIKMSNIYNEICSVGFLIF